MVSFAFFLSLSRYEVSCCCRCSCWCLMSLVTWFGNTLWSLLLSDMVSHKTLGFLVCVMFIRNLFVVRCVVLLLSLLLSPSPSSFPMFLCHSGSYSRFLLSISLVCRVVRLVLPLGDDLVQTHTSLVSFQRRRCLLIRLQLVGVAAAASCRTLSRLLTAASA